MKTHILQGTLTRGPLRLVLMLTLLLATITCVKAQVVNVYASEGKDGVVHLIYAGVYDNPAMTPYVLGYYSDVGVRNDSDRLSGAILLSSTPLADNWAVMDQINRMWDFQNTHSYDMLDANCGTAIDWCEEQGGVDSDHFWDYETVAIVETGWNKLDYVWNEVLEYCDGTSIGMMASLWDGFKDFFE